MTIAELRAAIERAHAAHDPAALLEFQAQHRALDPLVRRQLITAERDDQHARRRIVRSCSTRPAGVARATDEPTSSEPTLYGHFAVFDVWTEVESWWEGNFMERLAPGSCVNTIKNDRAQMRMTFNHGHDATMGNQVIAHPIRELREDKIGAYYEATSIEGLPAVIENGLRAGAYGASFRFYVMAEELESKPKPSDYNPRGIPERTLTEVLVQEFGPVTFPQYPEATAQLRARSLVFKRTQPTAAGSPSREKSPRSRDAWIASL